MLFMFQSTVQSSAAAVASSRTLTVKAIRNWHALHFSMHQASPIKRNGQTFALTCPAFFLSPYNQATINYDSHTRVSEQATGAMHWEKVYNNSEKELPLLNHDVRTTCRMWRSCFCNSSSTLCDWDNKGPEYSTFSSWSWSPWSFKWHISYNFVDMKVETNIK